MTEQNPGDALAKFHGNLTHDLAPCKTHSRVADGPQLAISTIQILGDRCGTTDPKRQAKRPGYPSFPS